MLSAADHQASLPPAGARRPDPAIGYGLGGTLPLLQPSMSGVLTDFPARLPSEPEQTQVPAQGLAPRVT